MAVIPRRVQRQFDDVRASIGKKVREFIVRDCPPGDLSTLNIGELPILTVHSHPTVDALRADLRVVRGRGYAMDDEETVEGVVCFGVMIPGRRPWEGPYAASITLLKARATDERVPLLIDDLHRLADRLSDPLRAGHQSRPAVPQPSP